MLSELINSDFSQRVLIATDQQPWVPSPQIGVERSLRLQPGDAEGHTRLCLYTAGTNEERVTIERLGAGTTLPASVCPGGEEIFVVCGELVDEYGSYGSGTWIRNPAGFRHRLGSNSGATYWAKRGHLGSAASAP